MSYVDQIVSRFGNLKNLSQLTGKPYSTVKSWKDRGSIPDQHKPEVLGAARQHGIALSPADFFPTCEGVPTAAP